MDCSYCDTNNPTNAKFCIECGKKLCNVCAEDEASSQLTTCADSCIEDILGNVANFKAVLDNALDPFIITNGLGIVVYWNIAATKMLGYEQQEAIGKPLHILILPEFYHKSYEEIFKQFNAKGKNLMFEQSIERSLLKKDRSMLHAEISFSTLKYNNILFVVGSVRDITHRKQFEEQIKKEQYNLETQVELTAKELEISQKRYRNLFFHMIEGIEINELIYNDYGYPVDFKILDVNPSYEMLTGIPKATAIGAYGSQLYSTENLDFTLYQKVVEQKESFYQTKKIQFSGKYFRFAFFPLENKRFAVIFQDITEQIETEKKLQLTQFSVDNATLPIFWLNKKGKFYYVNNEAIRTLGYSKEELQNMYIYDIDSSLIKEEWPKKFKRRVQSSYFSLETTLLRKDNKRLSVLLNGNTIEDEGEKYIHIFVVDLSVSKENEKIKENFIATLSHDLRVPLLAENMTLKYFQKGTYGPLSVKQQEAINNMIESNVDLLNLVNTLLDVYKYESQAIIPFRERINITQLIQKCVNELAPLTNGSKYIEFQITSNEDIYAFIDKKLIKRVLINIISNAINYSQENSSINIDISKDGPEIILAIRDYGHGIHPDELDKIFDRYFTSTKKFRKVGTGLGLYLSKQIIDAHQGKIWVDSELNAGSVFYIHLPG